MNVYDIDESLEDADWLRTRSWDLPTDLDGFLAVVGEQNVAHFLTLPVAQAMPPSLREALEGYFAEAGE